MKKKYYKPKKLVIGIFLFGLSMLFLGMLIITNVKDGVQDSKDMIYTIGFIISIVMMIVGEGSILDASSYDTNCVKDVRGKKDG